MISAIKINETESDDEMIPASPMLKTNKEENTVNVVSINERVNQASRICSVNQSNRIDHILRPDYSFPRWQ